MSSGNQIRTRERRVAALVLPPGRFARFTQYIRRSDVIVRLSLCLAAAIVMWAVTFGWAPPFAFRTGFIPQRDIVARVEFSREDAVATEAARQQARNEALCLYTNRPQPLRELQKELKDRVFVILGASAPGELDDDRRQLWQEFLPPERDGETLDHVKAFAAFHETLSNDMTLAEFEKAVERALQPFVDNGLLENLDEAHEGNQTAILVHPPDEEKFAQRVEVSDVRIGEVTAKIEARLSDEFKAAGISEQHAPMMARLIFHWLQSRLPTTLAFNSDGTHLASEKAVSGVAPVMATWFPGRSVIAPAGEPLSRDNWEGLRSEYEATLAGLTALDRTSHSLANLGMYVALYVLCGVYVFFHERRLLKDLRRFSTVLGLVVVTVTLCELTSSDRWRAEVIPLMLFGMTIALAYERELALLLSAVVALIVTITLGQGLAEFVITVATVSAAVLLLGRVRSRTKLIYVGLFAGLVAVLTTIGVGTLFGQAYGAADGDVAMLSLDSTDASPATTFALSLLIGSLRIGFFAVLAGVLMTGVLPFVEKLCDVQTDISLLELGDAAHPLLQELARRAPGTYNHSINVGSIGEAAAEAIGANGLLVRVAAYFHDIGKMLNPEYFIENQGQAANQHESLLPAMSTLVIIAHVKDGANLARQHRLPQSIIDFIEQHHGTTLVEFFYRRATEQSESDPDRGEIDETSFRYPGPKPQTREAAVMMLSDSVESASRTLTEPTPARIESLVDDIAMNRLLDDQFDECGITLTELNAVKKNLVKSLTSVYHGRVKYPDQQTA